MVIDSEYRLKLVENLEKNDHYSDFFDRFKAMKLSLFDLHIYFELTIPPTETTIGKEKLELYSQWQKDSHVYLTIFIWKKICTIVGFNGIHETYQFRYIWFENFQEFESQLNKFIQYFYSHYLSKVLKTLKSVKLTKARFEGWRGRTQAYRELLTKPNSVKDKKK